jgi:hypothetical protein
MGNALSADCRFLAFDCDASNLVAGDNNAMPDLLARSPDRATVRVSEAERCRGRRSLEPSISPTVFVLHEALTNLVLGDTNQNQTFSSTTCRRARPCARARAPPAGKAAVTVTTDDLGDGWVSFTSNAADLVAGDTNGSSDVFVHDMQTGRRRASASTRPVRKATPDRTPPLSDGRFVSFWSSPRTSSRAR